MKEQKLKSKKFSKVKISDLKTIQGASSVQATIVDID